MSYTGPAKVVVRATRPAEPGPSSAIRYDLWVQPDDGDVMEFLNVGSNDRTYSDEVACVGAPVGSSHPAHITAGRLSLWITPVPTYINCEDIE